MNDRYSLIQINSRENILIIQPVQIKWREQTGIESIDFLKRLRQDRFQNSSTYRESIRLKFADWGMIETKQ